MNIGAAGVARSSNSLNILRQSEGVRTLPTGELSMEHRIATRNEWLAARQVLLAQEKEHTRVSDELNRQRRELPWIRVEKEYVFDAPTGKITLAELFDGRSQLFIKHFMMGPGAAHQCVGCSLEVD